MIQGTYTDYQKAYIFPYEQINEICRNQSWDKIEQMIIKGTLHINYPFINGQVVGVYPYGDSQAQQYTTLSYLQYNGLPTTISHALQEKYNAMSSSDLYVFQCAYLGHWDIISSIKFNHNLKDLFSDMTISDYAYTQGQEYLAKTYYSHNNVVFIQPASPILSSIPMKTNINLVPQLEKISYNSTTEMLNAAAGDDWQAVMAYIDAGCPVDAKDHNGKDLLDWANFHEQEQMASFLQSEMMGTLSIGTTLYTPLKNSRKQDVGYVGQERETEHQLDKIINRIRKL